MPAPSACPSAWTVVLPVKGGPAAKSRLGAPGPLAGAIALDTLEAVLACTAVRRAVVVTADAATARHAARAGADVRPETRSGAGLSAAVDDGLAGLDGPVAVLLADLPALRPEDLAAALRAAGQVVEAGGWALVPDAEGTGSVLVAAGRPEVLRPSFGPCSAAAHEAAGAVRLDLDVPRLRRDVDTRADLEAALRLGVGPRTRTALARPDAGSIVA